MAKGKTAGRAKTDARYWEPKVYKPSFTEKGQRIEAKHFSVRLQFKGERHNLPLGTGNREAAGKAAAKRYRFLIANGWPVTLAEFSVKNAPKPETVATVGELIAEAEANATAAPRTLSGYAAAFRRMVADIEGISSEIVVERKRRVTDKDGKKRLKVVKEIKDVRFDYNAKWRNNDGGRDAWLEKVNAVSLERITPAKVNKWRLGYVRDRADDPAAERSAKNTANAIMGKAKGLFSGKVLPYVTKTLTLPNPLPFEGVKAFPRQSMRYKSKIDAGELIGKAAEELPAIENGEPFKVFLLAAMAGLRAGEIDTLLWRQIDFEAGTLTIEATKYFKPKSEDSAGAVDLDPEVVAILRGYHAKARGKFVIASKRPPKTGTRYPYRRAKKAFDALAAWLKENGIDARKPIHELRKEFGSRVCEKFGLYAASRALRHADVAITAAHYLDKKERVTAGLGGFLNPDVVPFEQPEESEDGKETGNG